jgi:hypothetical protein
MCCFITALSSEAIQSAVASPTAIESLLIKIVLLKPNYQNQGDFRSGDNPGL